MGVLTTIAGVPLYSTTQEAKRWAAANSCSGYHIHNFQGQTGFMGCTNHQQASGMPINSNAPTPQASPPTPQNNPSGGGGGGGGGGY